MNINGRNFHAENKDGRRYKSRTGVRQRSQIAIGSEAYLREIQGTTAKFVRVVQQMQDWFSNLATNVRIFTLITPLSEQKKFQKRKFSSFLIASPN